MVTLTVSSGQSDEVRANFDNRLVLLTCELNEVTFRPGGAVQLLLTWEVTDYLPDAYTLFIHMIDREGHIVSQRDEPPLHGDRPTNTWQPGERLLDPHTLNIPANLPSGDYWIHLGLYRGNWRLPVADPGLVQADGNAIIVRQVVVQRN